MDNLKKLWDKFKGTIAMLALTSVVGIAGVTASIGLEVVDGPDGAICFQEAPVVVALAKDLEAE